jgi:hypothetical protein
MGIDGQVDDVIVCERDIGLTANRRTWGRPSMLKTPLCDLLGIDVPILLAPMGLAGPRPNSLRQFPTTCFVAMHSADRR